MYKYVCVYKCAYECVGMKPPLSHPQILGHFVRKVQYTSPYEYSYATDVCTAHVRGVRVCVLCVMNVYVCGECMCV